MARLIRVLTISLVILVVSTLPAQQIAKTQATGYANSSEGLHKFLQDTYEAAKSANSQQETALIKSLIFPEDTGWFVDEFGPAFGKRMAIAYRKGANDLVDQIRAVYDGNLKAGMIDPKIIRYDDPAKADAPIDRFLNSMNEIAPLYRTASFGGRTATRIGIASGPEKAKILSGDLPGYYIFANGGFRFLPAQLLFMVPNERPVRIRVAADVMNTKITHRVNWMPPHDAIQQRVQGKVIVRLLIDVHGKVEEATPIEGPAVLRDSFAQCVKGWTFEPTTLDGEAVEVETEIETAFQIQHRGGN